MNLFYQPNIHPKDTQIVFEKEESRHITKVMRKKVGDYLYVTNGKGYIFTSEIKEITPKRIEATIITSEEKQPMPYRLHMAVAPTKNNDRFEWFLEKATEIGIHSITPIYCDHSERKTIKPERLEKIIQSAMKQSLKAYLPILHPAVSFSTFLETKQDASILKCIAHCEDTPKASLQSVIHNSKDILLLIGPEGDFSQNEIQISEKQGFKSVSLGESRLRTETAAIVGCHTVALLS